MFYSVDESKDRFGEDVNGNTYYFYIDKSHTDFWIETVVKKNKLGKYMIYSCNITPKLEEKQDAS